MPANEKPDKWEFKGVSRSLRTAFAPDSPIDPELERLIRKTDGKYVPDEIADKRRDQLISRLEKLPWDDPPKETNHVRSSSRI